MGSGEHEFPVAATLVVRNTDPASSIVVTTVDYRDSDGAHLRHYVNAPVVETLMIGRRGTQGISFIGRAWVIEERGDVQGEGGPQAPSD
ncbi:MAG: DUF3124 domain-containing protein [bacterium]|nr:DUF3124 domain-containing protein [bacterium]